MGASYAHINALMLLLIAFDETLACMEGCKMWTNDVGDREWLPDMTEWLKPDIQYCQKRISRAIAETGDRLWSFTPDGETLATGGQMSGDRIPCTFSAVRLLTGADRMIGHFGSHFTTSVYLLMTGHSGMALPFISVDGGGLVGYVTQNMTVPDRLADFAT